MQFPCLIRLLQKFNIVGVECGRIVAQSLNLAQVQDICNNPASDGLRTYSIKLFLLWISETVVTLICTPFLPHHPAHLHGSTLYSSPHLKRFQLSQYF